MTAYICMNVKNTVLKLQYNVTDLARRKKRENSA